MTYRDPSFSIHSSYSLKHHPDKAMKSPAKNHEGERLCRFVMRALDKSFPGHASQHEVALHAREYFLGRDGTPISARTIKYWLEGSSLPSAPHLVTLIQMQPTLFLATFLGL